MSLNARMRRALLCRRDAPQVAGVGLHRVVCVRPEGAVIKSVSEGSLGVEDVDGGDGGKMVPSVDVSVCLRGADACARGDMWDATGWN